MKHLFTPEGDQALQALGHRTLRSEPEAGCEHQSDYRSADAHEILP